MIKLKRNNTHKKLILLIGIFLIGFTTLFTLNKAFTSFANELDEKTKNLEAKIMIGELIAYDFVKIRALFHELATTTSSKKARENIVEKIEDLTDVIDESLLILENGGILKRFVALNIEGHLNTVRTIEYKVTSKEQISLETIDIRPKLIELTIMIKEANILLENRAKYKKEKNSKKFSKSARKIRRYYKSLPAYFTRISENIRRLLYDGEVELNIINEQIRSDKRSYSEIKLILIIFIISIVVIFGYFITKNVSKDNDNIYDLNIELNKTLERQAVQEKAIRAILDTQSNIIIVSNGSAMIDANEQLIKFFDQYSSLKEFKEDAQSISKFFDKDVPNDEYIVKKDYDGLTWLEYIMIDQNRSFKVIMKKDGEKYHFLIKATKKLVDISTGELVIIITLNDITSEVNSQIRLKNLNENLEVLVQNKTKELQELNENLELKVQEQLKKGREKDKQMIQQSRFAALGEMIGNIAHQWRQPLSAINSTASSMQVQMELGIEEKKDIEKSYTDIISYVGFLTQTIEDFRGFFKEDKETVDFDIIETINRSLSLTSAVYKSNDIEIVTNFANLGSLNSHGLPSELSQVFLNILNNAKDATVTNKPDKRYVNIRAKETKDEAIIYIQDNAGGIPMDIITKIFDPYFTTKHQSQGTGIGLYMSKNIVETHMKGSIKVENKQEQLDGVSYNGACFKIILPKKHKEA